MPRRPNKAKNGPATKRRNPATQPKTSSSDQAANDSGQPVATTVIASSVPPVSVITTGVSAEVSHSPATPATSTVPNPSAISIPAVSLMQGGFHIPNMPATSQSSHTISSPLFSSLGISQGISGYQQNPCPPACNRVPCATSNTMSTPYVALPVPQGPWVTSQTTLNRWASRATFWLGMQCGGLSGSFPDREPNRVSPRVIATRGKIQKRARTENSMVVSLHC